MELVETTLNTVKVFALTKRKRKKNAVNSDKIFNEAKLGKSCFDIQFIAPMQATAKIYPQANPNFAYINPLILQ